MNISLNPLELEVLTDDQIENLLYNTTNMNQLPPLTDVVIGPYSSDFGIVLQHGFIGGNLEMLYLGYNFAKHGYRVIIPVLPGHGQNFLALHRVDRFQWYKKMDLAIAFLKKENPNRMMFLVGHSLGGTLAIKTASENQNISGIITLAAPIGYPPPFHKLVKVVNKFKPNLILRYRKFRFFDHRLESHPYVSFIYKNYSYITMNTLFQVVKTLERGKRALKKLKTPLLVINSEGDTTIWPDNGWKIYSKTASKCKGFIQLYNSSHLIPVELDKEYVLKISLEFLNRIIENTN